MKHTNNRTKRVRHLAAAAFAATLIVGAAQGWASGPGPHVVADIVTEDTVMMLNAVVHQDGSVTGEFEYTRGENFAIGVPTCVHVEGDRAYISVLATSAEFNGGDFAGFTFSFWVDDNGVPGNQGDIQGLGWFLPNVPPFGVDPCRLGGFRNFLNGAPQRPVVDGNILIQG